jgi:hypothetical protein
MPRKSKSLFPDDSAIQIMAQTKQVQADALPHGPEKANSKRKLIATRFLRRPGFGCPAI